MALGEVKSSQRDGTEKKGNTEDYSEALPCIGEAGWVAHVLVILFSLR